MPAFLSGLSDLIQYRGNRNGQPLNDYVGPAINEKLAKESFHFNAIDMNVTFYPAVDRHSVKTLDIKSENLFSLKKVLHL